MAKRSNYPSKKLPAMANKARRKSGYPATSVPPLGQASSATQQQAIVNQIANTTIEAILDKNKELEESNKNLNQLVDIQEKMIERLEKKVVEIEAKLKNQEEKDRTDGYRKQIQDAIDQMRKTNPQPPVKPYPNPWFEPRIGDQPNPWREGPYTPWISYSTNQSQIDSINSAFKRSLATDNAEINQERESQQNYFAVNNPA